MSQKNIVLSLLILLNLILIFQNPYINCAEYTAANSDIEWLVEKGDTFTWIVKESNSDKFDFLPVNSSYTLEITEIDTTSAYSQIKGILTKYDKDKDKETQILDSELFLRYNHTPSSEVKFFTPFLDQCFVAPKAFTDFFSSVYNFYSHELGFNGASYENENINSLLLSNSSNSVELIWSFNSDNNVAESLEVTEYGETTYLLELEVEEEPEANYLWVIILVIIIGAVGGVAGFVFVRKRSSKKRAIALKKKTMGTKDTTKETNQPQSITQTAGITKIERVKKIQSPSILNKPIDISEVEKQELKKTEAEVGVEKKELMCIVHRGPIMGATYACPNCQTLYCQKCAATLKEKGEKCWSCNQEIKL